MKVKKLLFPLALLLMSASGYSAQEMIRNGQFEENIDGWWSSGGEVKVGNNTACMKIANPGANSWSIILGHSGIGLAKGERYQITFDAYADSKTQFKTLIQHQGPPYTHYVVQDTFVTTEKKSYRYEFIHEEESDESTEFQFQMGAQQKGEVCVSNVSVVGKPYIKKSSVSPLRVNQLGFLPQSDKFVFVQSDSEQPLRWVLVDGKGISIDMGRTTVIGINEASAENLHRIDLTKMDTDQIGLKIRIGEEESYPFDIRSSLYSKLKYDAFSYFYQNRSGIEIEEQFVQRSDLARPAGHPSDVATCFNSEDSWGNKWPGCDFTIDATGGWYDAGDHGKYVVNSGITTWTLLNLYERGKWLENAEIPFADGEGNIPESGDGVNDLLSEARWNVEFMLSMQIPMGKKVAAPIGDQTASRKLTLQTIDGSHLAFHKIADDAWTGAPLAPHEDTQTRHVGQPSTAATLNLAAIGAQCSRIWKEIDSAFAERCLLAAENAWEAAVRQPEIYAYDNFTGSGPYDGTDMADEFYWAASELFITTGSDKYRDFLKSSPHFLSVPKGDKLASNDIFWQFTAPLGTISLAVVPNSLEDTIIQSARDAIVKTASNYKAQMAHEGYHIPYSVAEYPWGSNSNLVNRGIFLVYAHDFTGDISYVKAAANAMDYLLGANPLSLSYITGYGSNAAQNPHHRFWAHEAGEPYPKPAPGALIGGPNSISFSDPIAGTMKGRCTGQTCYTDESGAWTMNEITINWNAPLVWLSSALDEGQLN